jgi:nucleotide-binding universal stress UspA family protein
MTESEARRILVPINGNPTDQEMIQLACGLARKGKGEVHAIYIIEVKRTLPLDADLPPESELGERVLEHAEATAEKLGMQIQADLLQARDVGPTIIEEAREREADLILLGITYKKRFGEFDLGATTPYVLKHAPCRVWICRQPIEK